MKELEHRYFNNREGFRSWLSENHNKSDGIWLKFYKKQMNVDCVQYSEALEEALCFGWVDSIIKKINSEYYVRKFTPRTNISKWSDVNKRIVLSLIERNKMTKAGLLKIDNYVKTGNVDWVNIEVNSNKKDEIIVPEYVIKILAENEPALKNFNCLANSYKRHYIRWITNSKREETIQKRLKESIDLLKVNKKLGLK